VEIYPWDVEISYLSVGGIFERIIQASLFFNGAAIGFFQGEIPLLIDDIALLRPTLFPVSPALLGSSYEKVNFFLFFFENFFFFFSSNS
jgi:long-chain acyl-CoA synthetase